MSGNCRRRHIEVLRERPAATIAKMWIILRSKDRPYFPLMNSK